MTTSQISQEDRQLIAELRKRLKKELELSLQFDDDFSLLRWLVAWDRNIDIIVPKFILSIRVSNAMGLNKMELKTIEQVTEACNNCSEGLQYLPGSVIGFDKEGFIVYLDVMGRMEATEIVRCVKSSDCYIMKITESYGIMEILRAKEKELGKQLGSAIIFDLEGLGFSQLAIVNQFTPVIQLLQDMFPDVVRKFYVVNAPTFVQVLYKMISPVLAKQTREKLRVLGSDYKQILKNDIGEEVMFKHWGGSREAASDFGNIKMGGKPPDSLRKDKKDAIPVEDLTKLTVSARSASFVPIKLEGHVPGRKLRWYWLLDSGDIHFGILKAAKGQEEVPEHESDHLCWPKWKLNTDYVPESGEISAEQPGLYKFVFDNSHGLVWSKTIRFLIDIRD